MRVRTEARREAIVEAATELFKEMGYERASMNELAKRLGGSKSTLYGYFSSKEELFVAVVEAVATGHLLDATQELAAEVAHGKPTLEARLGRFGERMLGVLTHDESALAVYRMVVAEAGRSDVGQLFYDSGPAAAMAALTGLMAAAMDRGELRRSDPKVAAAHFTALVMAETDMRLFQRNPPPLSLKEIRRMVGRGVEMFMRGAAQS
ncbi:transcriptional regulator, TetR family [Variovorax sp. HW608]|uniref:TetR/AcrR family transcriptional regulator n=1 Tax=Variovorax sp. HW608 TaxID=1034889 RepID=UPI00081FB355|nr:TetR/AcrR family transcriptional regulator [Variovorax sp. HW608]SCK30494.1 transcriptional regulator, TetR family [Variovorax sp. HW608]